MKQLWSLNIVFDSDEDNADGGVNEECKHSKGKSNGEPDENNYGSKDPAQLSLLTEFHTNMLRADVFLAFSEGH